MFRLLAAALVAAFFTPIAPKAEAQEDYLGRIFFVPFNYCPRGSAGLNGQVLPIAPNSALFSLLGTTYGGDGRTTFALPDLRGRVIIGSGTSVSDGTRYSPGQVVQIDEGIGAQGLVMTACIATRGIYPSRN